MRDFRQYVILTYILDSYIKNIFMIFFGLTNCWTKNDLFFCYQHDLAAAFFSSSSSSSSSSFIIPCDTRLHSLFLEKLPFWRLEIAIYIWPLIYDVVIGINEKTKNIEN